MKESAAARALSPKKQTIIVEQGLEAFQAGKYADAKDLFMQAYQLDTDYADPAGYAAAAMIATGDISGGKTLLTQAYGTTTVNNPLLVVGYYNAKDWNDLIAVLQLKLKDEPTAMNGFQLAAAYSEAGRRSDAIAQVHATMDAYPDAQAQGEALLQQLGVSE
jgi:thioredoxin-like negative regulator of GroEL